MKKSPVRSDAWTVPGGMYDSRSRFGCLSPCRWCGSGGWGRAIGRSLLAFCLLVSASRAADPYSYLIRDYYEDAALPQPDYPTLTLQGATDIRNGTEFVVLYSDGRLAFFTETQVPDLTGHLLTDAYKVVPTKGRTGVAEVSGAFPGPLAVSDTAGVDFYDYDGNWKARKNISTSGLIDLSYNPVTGKILLATRSNGIYVLNGDDSLVAWYDPYDGVYYPSFEGIRYIRMEPGTQDLLQFGQYFVKVEADGTITAAPFKTYLGNFDFNRGIVYLRNHALMVKKDGLYVYDKILLQNHMRWGFCSPVAADFDGDCDVDGDDFALFKVCVSGPAMPYGGDCGAKDLDDDDDVDQADFGVFQRCYSGQGMPARAGCEAG